MKLGGNLPPGHDAPVFDKWHGIFPMSSRTDTAAHSKTFDYPVMDHWGKSRRPVFFIVFFIVFLIVFFIASHNVLVDMLYVIMFV